MVIVTRGTVCVDWGNDYINPLGSTLIGKEDF